MSTEVGNTKALWEIGVRGTVACANTHPSVLAVPSPAQTTRRRHLTYKVEFVVMYVYMFAYSSRRNKPIYTKLGMLIP
jgi:hypothetical protein